MGKTIGKVLKVVGAVALTVATFNPGFLALAGISAGALGIAGAVSAVAGGLLDPPSSGAAMAEQGRTLTLRTDATASRRVLYGMAATGGTLLYREATGVDNKNLHLVIALAGHKTTGLEEFKFGKELVNLDASGGAIGKYANYMSVSFHDGSDDQIADAGLVGASSKWTGDHKLSGISYAYIKLVWDHEIFPQGLENTLFTLKGRKLYDPRQDPSNGGLPLGTHNLNDETTWDWSDNPVLAMIDYLMGIKVGGKLVAGMGVSADRIDWANIIAEANICDEKIALRAGGDEPRYTLNGWVDPNQSHRDNLNAISSSCGGTLVFQSGKWRCYVAIGRAAVKARSADDVVGSITMHAKKSTSQKVNSVKGIFADPNSNYELKDFPPLQDQNFIAEDGGNELWRDVNLPFTKSASMAQRLAKISLGRARMEKVVKANFTLAVIQDQAMDTISFTHDRFNLNNQNMICVDWRLAVSQTKSGNEGLVVECTLVEDSAEIYSWSAASDEEVVVQAEEIITPDRLYLDHGKIPGEISYSSQVLGNVFSDTAINFADATIGFGTASKPDMNATVGAEVGNNFYKVGGVNPYMETEFQNADITLNEAGYLNNIGTAEIIQNTKITIDAAGVLQGVGTLNKYVANEDITLGEDGNLTYKGGTVSIGAVTVPGLGYGGALADLDGTANTKLGGIAAGATVGAIAGTNFYKTGGVTPYASNEFQNIDQEWLAILDTGGKRPADNATKNTGALADKNSVDMATADVANKVADNITNSALKRWVVPRREMGAGSLTASNPVSAVDAGGDSTINIAAHTQYLGDGIGISFNSGSITGRSFLTTYYVYATVTTLASGTQTVTYQSTTTKQTITQSDNYYYVGYVTTPANGGVPTDGSGGGGGGTDLP